jgi:hypothetical protein
LGGKIERAALLPTTLLNLPAAPVIDVTLLFDQLRLILGGLGSLCSVLAVRSFVHVF